MNDITINEDKDDGDSDTNSKQTTETRATIKSIWSNKETRIMMIIYWMFSFTIVSTDELIPLFGLADNEGALKLIPRTIGTFMSTSGTV